jgi:hypothetical protein
MTSAPRRQSIPILLNSLIILNHHRDNSPPRAHRYLSRRTRETELAPPCSKVIFFKTSASSFDCRLAISCAAAIGRHYHERTPDVLGKPVPSYALVRLNAPSHKLLHSALKTASAGGRQKHLLAPGRYCSPDWRRIDNRRKPASKRSARSCNRLQQFLRRWDAAIAIADQDAVSASVEIGLVYAGNAVDDAADADGVVCLVASRT